MGLRRYLFWRLLFILGLLILAGCGVHPYDYLDLAQETLEAAVWGTPTAGETIEMVPTFTPLPPASATATATASPTATALPPTPTPTLLDTPPPGKARLMLENRIPFTVYVRLRDGREWVFELAAAEAQLVEIPAGVYEYWVVINGEESLHGQRAIPPGLSQWVFYDTPGVLESPTPMWPGWGNLQNAVP